MSGVQTWALQSLGLQNRGHVQRWPVYFFFFYRFLLIGKSYVFGGFGLLFSSSLRVCVCVFVQRWWEATCFRVSCLPGYSSLHTSQDLSSSLTLSFLPLSLPSHPTFHSPFVPASLRACPTHILYTHHHPAAPHSPLSTPRFLQ